MRQGLGGASSGDRTAPGINQNMSRVSQRSMGPASIGGGLQVNLQQSGVSVGIGLLGSEPRQTEKTRGLVTSAGASQPIPTQASINVSLLNSTVTSDYKK